MKYIPWILLLSLFAFASLSSFTPEEVALKAEQKLFSITSIKANFTQIYISKSLSTPLQEKGEFFFKKPGLMKWLYQEPEKKIFLLKEGNFDFLDFENNQLIRGSLSTENHESEILELLSGKLRFQDRYHIEFTQPPKDPDRNRIFHLTLTPKVEYEYSLIQLEIDERTWLIQKVIFFDWADNKTEIHFSRIRANTSFPQNTFEIEIPPGVEIIKNNNSL